MKLMLGDCLELMKEIPDGSVDMVLCDPPYGTTACKWDSVIPLEPMWEHIKRLCSKNGVVCLFGSEPFSSLLRASNLKDYKYDWVWKKSRFANQLLAKKQPLKVTENISVFQLGKCVYNPQGLIRVDKITKQGKRVTDINGGGKRNTEYRQEFTNYPRNVLEFKSPGNTVHPTQKPVDLLEYLIRTYTEECQIVLDFAMGSGSTGVACVNTGRDFIGIELDEGYFETAKQRIAEAQKKNASKEDQ